MRALILALTQQLEAKEETRKEARDALRASERAISEANRTLAALEAESREVRAQAAAIAQRRKLLQHSLEARKATIGRMLAARQASGAPDALRAVLSGDDPGDASRTLHYVSYVARASAAMLAEYRSGIAEAQQLAQQAQEKHDRLSALEAASRADRERILAERKERRRVLARVALEVRNSRSEIKVLRADEARLARLVEELGRVAAARVESGSAFSRLRGRLALPVRGELASRFGAPRGASGSEAKGVFIRAPEGQPVRAVASGQVVYADWMRGFGNLLILDHGEAYLSIYANAEALLKQVGDVVAPGEAIATTGASGGSEQTGLYFELRHLGRAFDPLRWVKRK